MAGLCRDVHGMNVQTHTADRACGMLHRVRGNGRGWKARDAVCGGAGHVTEYS